MEEKKGNRRILVEKYDPETDEYTKVGAILYSESKQQQGFVYDESYQGPPLDPAHLNYQQENKRVFLLSKHQDIHDVFKDAMPGKFGEKLYARKYPEYSQLEPINKLWLLGTRKANGLRFTALEADGTPAPARTLAQLDQFIMQARGVESNARKMMDDTYLQEIREMSGGKRPKWRMLDGNHNEWMVKFNSPNDPYNNTRMEYVSFRFMEAAWINTPVAQMKRTPGGEDVLFTKRFDGAKSQNRKHKVSLESLVGKKPSYDYTDMVDAIKRHSAKPDQDLELLFRSMLADAVLHNTDNHLKNFEMVEEKEGWRLSPQFDKLPDAMGGSHSTTFAAYPNADIMDDEFFERARNAFGIPAEKATEIRNDLITAAQQLPEIALEAELAQEDFDLLIKAVHANSKTLANSIIENMKNEKKQKMEISHQAAPKM